MVIQKLIYGITGMVLGVVMGSGGMLVAFPYLFPPESVNESVSAMIPDARPASTTTFRSDAPGQDPVHWGKGDIHIYQQGDSVLLEFQENFEVGPGPNFWVYLNTRANIDDEADFQRDRERIRLQKIKSFVGSQVYEVSKADYNRAKAVTVWCETFNQYIASANLP